MQDTNPTQTPYTSLTAIDQHASTSSLPPNEATRFRHILGEVRYITNCTRPDVAYATNRLAQHMYNPQQHHKPRPKMPSPVSQLHWYPWTMVPKSMLQQPNRASSYRLQRCRLCKRAKLQVSNRNCILRQCITNFLNLPETNFGCSLHKRS